MILTQILPTAITLTVNRPKNSDRFAFALSLSKAHVAIIHKTTQVILPVDVQVVEGGRIYNVDNLARSDRLKCFLHKERPRFLFFLMKEAAETLT